MRDLRRRLLIGLAVVVVGVMVVGYSFIFRGVAAPPGGELGEVAVPANGETAAATLDDGRPVFVVAIGGRAIVLDARVPRAAGDLGALAAWCPPDRTFVDPGRPGIFGDDGSLLGGAAPTGLTVHASHPVGEGSQRVAVDPETTIGATAPDQRLPSYSCGANDWVVHEARPEDVFDPSVAVDGEPPGWIWLEGRLEVIDGQVLLCDGTDLEAPGCPAGAIAVGIDPATIPREARSGRFLGFVRDGEIAGLAYVPDRGTEEGI